MNDYLRVSHKAGGQMLANSKSPLQSGDLLSGAPSQPWRSQLPSSR